MSLLDQVAGLLQRTYDMRTELPTVAPFVVGDEGFRQLYRDPDHDRHSEHDGAGARTVVREVEDHVRATIYLPDGLVRQLEAYPPQRGLRRENLHAFAALIEEVDHLLVLANRRRQGRGASLFELELHADVSKYLVLARYLSGQRPKLSARRKTWLRHHLFESSRFDEPVVERQDRYREARRHAVRFLDALPALESRRRLKTLREFHHVDGHAKVRLIHRLAA